MKFSAIRSAAAALFLLLPCTAPAQEDPESVYGKFHRALRAGNLAEMTRYGTPTGGAQVAAMPPEQRKAMLEMMKKLIPQNYSITGKEISPDGNRATLRATGTATSLFGGKQETQYSSIRLLKQGGEWKVDESSWSNTPPAGPLKAAAKPQGAPVVGSTSAAPPRTLGTAKPECVYKPVMTDEDIENCR
jgi:hypothetical protein